MCGIVGFIENKRWLQQDDLLAMRDVLSHRGPDDAGLLYNEGDPSVTIGLAHRRLSIIDVSEGGHQPMSNEDGSIWIVYNGEFYNYQDYKEELLEKGHVLHSSSDTEMLLHLYEEVGIDGVLTRINGMFSFAIWDEQQQKLFLARDRAGQKPLYYAVCEKGVVFASEIKALQLLGDRIDCSLNGVAVADYWIHGYCLDGTTFYRGIKQLPAGCIAVVDTPLAGDINIRSYINEEDVEPSMRPFGRIDMPKQNCGVELDASVDELEALLTDAVRLRLIADVPVGLFLSGGIDSSLIAAIATKRLGVSLETFTISFANDAFDEADYAHDIADYLGLTHHVMRVDEQLGDYFEEIVRHMDEPFGDPSIIPMWFLCRETSRYVKVVLSGDAGDELFAGYDEYGEANRIWGRGMRWTSPRDLMARLMGPSAWHCFKGRRISYKDWRSVMSSEFRNQHAYWRTVFGRTNKGHMTRDCDALQQIQATDFKSYLVNDVLVKVDRASMAHGLECRSPLLDPRIIEWSGRLPRSLKIGPNGEQKYILRCLLERYIPKTLWDRPKQGFTPPWEAWFTAEVERDVAQKMKCQKSQVFTDRASRILLNEHADLVRKWQAFAWGAAERGADRL